jgi:hypothetical protein
VSKAVSDKTLKVLEAMQARTAMIVPNDFDVSLLESTRDPRQLFESAVDPSQRRYARSMLVFDKSGYAGAPVDAGSHSLAETQAGLFALVIEQLQPWLQGIVNRSILKRMAFYEAGPDAPVPTLNLLPPSQSNKLAIAQVYTNAVATGAIVPDEAADRHFRSMIGFPEKSGPPLVRPPRPTPVPIGFTEENARRPLTQAERRANLPAIDSMMNRAGTKLRDVLVEGVSEMVADLKGKLPMIATMDEARELTVSTEVRDALRARVADVLLGAHREAKDSARDEVTRAKAHAIDSMVSACEVRAADKARKS